MHRTLGERDICVVSTYFNPSHYASRLKNFALFRRHLAAPLFVVEFSPDGAFELGDDAADSVLRVSPGAVLWQKERMLNLALERLPASVRHIAWVDCDFVFPDRDWLDATRQLLDRYELVQCFSELVNLEEGEAIAAASSPDRAPSGYAIAYLEQAVRHRPELASFRTLRHAFQGGAWAARRDLMQRHGFYDAMILGGADRALAAACLGRYQDLAAIHFLNEVRRAHYEAWARPFARATEGQVGCREGRALHLWHGSEQNRNYSRRHQSLAEAGFDPVRHLRIGPSGAWEWTDAAPMRLRELARGYFSLRQEDGAEA